MMRQTFRQDEAEQILRDAVRRDMERETAPLAQTSTNPEIPRARLEEMAAELGISYAALEAVLSDRESAALRQREQAIEQGERQEFITKRRASFLSDLYAYLGISGLLVIVSFAAQDARLLWPVLFWTMILYFHGIATLPTKGPVFERDFAASKEKKKRRQEKQAKSQARIARREERGRERRRGRDARRAAEAELNQ